MTRKYAAITLGKLGKAAKDAVPALIEALKDNFSGVRQYAAHALAQIGHCPAAKEAVPILTELFRNKREHILVRANAAWALGAIRHEVEKVVPILIEALSHENEPIRRGALLGLGEMNHPEAGKAVPKLIEFFENENEDEKVRRYTGQALGKIANAVPSARRKIIATLKKALKDENKIMRLSAVYGFTNAKDVLSSGTVSALCKRLEKDDFDDVRINISYLFYKMGRKTKSAISTLCKVVVKDKNEQVRINAIGALAKFLNKKIFRTLKKVLIEDESSKVRAEVPYSLSKNMNRAAKKKYANAMGPCLLHSLQKDKDPSVRRTVTYLLIDLGPNLKGKIRKEIVKVLAKIKNNSKETEAVRNNAAYALRQMGEF